jgi:hypothetical protein
MPVTRPRRFCGVISAQRNRWILGKVELARTLLFERTEMGTALKQLKTRHERPALRREGWILLMATNPPRAIWQKFKDNSRGSETSCALSSYSNFFQIEKHLPFKNLGLKR